MDLALSLSVTNPIVQLLIATMLGAFLGLRREMDAQRSSSGRSFMGLRTMTILCLIGAFSTLFSQFPYLPLIFFSGVLILVAIAYAHGSFAMNRIGMTTELSAMLTFWIGVLVGSGHQILAILITLFLAGVIEFREASHHFAKTLKPKEWFGAFQLLALSGAVLPFLPHKPIDPWGVFVPFNVWLIVILISGLGFIGYFLIKYFGARGGVPLTAFLGSIVSSTAVTASLSDQSRRCKLYRIFTGGILVALATMQFRVAGEIYFLGTQELSGFILVPVVMAFSSLLLALYFFLPPKDKKKGWFESWFEHKPETIKLDSPFEIGPALKFGLIFVFVLLALALGQKYLGNSGVYMASVLSGIIDIDAIVLSTLQSLKLGEMMLPVAKNSIALALFVNTIVKVGYVAILGARPLIGKTAVSAGVVTLIGMGVFFFL